MPDRRLPKHSVVIAGHATSVSLENEFWDALKIQAGKEGLALAALLARLDKERIRNNPQPPSLASTARVYVLKKLQDNR
ncbi:MAG: ribbon-helix-helix domain-containing protein [Bdellovibrionales bacterium]